jgi:cyclase
MVETRLRTLLRTSARCLMVCAAVAVAFVALAQGQDLKPPAPPPGPGDVMLSADLVKTGLYVISGGGGNSLLRLSASGSILVDGKPPAAHRALMSQVRKISRLSDLPVKVVIFTDPHSSRAGSHAQFLAAGIPVIAQKNAEQDLLAMIPAGAKPASPTITYEHSYKIRMGGVEAQLLHFGNARTNSDTVAFFPDLKVVAVGGLFSPEAPEPDFSAGGSLLGWGAVLDEVLKLDFDLVAPGNGPMASRADLQAFRMKIEMLVARAQALVKSGVAQEKFAAELQTDDLGWRFGFTAEQWGRFYAELAQTK